jgi:putative phosphoserine phosphatase/1-acylglycerol-3-phosphate O-acyltransferase
MERLGPQLFERNLEPALFPEMREIIEAHRRKGHTLVIASSATSIQVLPAARFLGIEEVLCTQLEARDGRLTGRIDGQLLWGPAKAVAAQGLAARRGIHLGQSYFYADGNEDAALMHLVGRPRPVNPQPRLARVAARRGWPAQRFTSRGPLPPVAVVRNLVATAAFLPVLAGAAAHRAVTGDRRQAANLLTTTQPELVLSFGKVQLDVIGEEHLWSQRPAVFIWNHRNVFDAHIVGKLVNRDFGAVAKKELATDPLFAMASQFMEIAFVDRRDHRAALAALEPVTRRLREGCSLVIAPEGTRVAGAGLGEFKKGAFRMAMAAGVPIVPIVIRNAEDLGSRTAMLIRPGSVDVAVLPPVSVRGWTRNNLDEHIAAIRQSFIDTLAEWPGPRRGRRARRSRA